MPKGPPRCKPMKGMSKMAGAGKQAMMTGGNSSGLAEGLAAARPIRSGRMANIKKQMFGGGK